MDLQAYINSFEKKKIKTDIVTRWKTRVLDGGLSLDARGARDYLAAYGTSMGADKAVGFALQAQSLGHSEMAMVFWTKAYTLEFGTPPSSNAVVGDTAPAVSVEKETLATISSLPANMQPGKIVPMQPVDSPFGVEALLNDDHYCMQAKRDGKKFLIFGTANDAWAQARSMNVVAIPSEEMKDAIKKVAANLGAFILETEIYYLSFDGKEHRTGSQALTWNQKHDNWSKPTIKCAPFYALFAGGYDLREDAQWRRIEVGRTITEALAGENNLFEALETARGHEEKLALYLHQKQHGHEGVVFSVIHSRYHEDKMGTDILREKFLMESIVRVTGLQSTTAAGKLFGAIVIVSDNGDKLGKVGTGFSREDERDVVAAFQANPTNTWIEIAHQGYTENGQVWHSRYRGLVQQ